MLMTDESDPAFLKRILAAMDAQNAAQEGQAPSKVTLASEDVLRLVMLYAGLPPTAMRIS